MNKLQIFNYNGAEVRTVEQNGETWWVLKDVCDILEVKNATDVAKRLDSDEVTRFNLGGLAGETNIINESGLYSVILRSDKPQAKPFRKWVTSEVLPSIRKTGSYQAKTVCIEDVLIQSLQEMKEVKYGLQQTNERIDGIRDIVALNPCQWREDARKLLVKIAMNRGGGGAYQEVNSECFALVDQRAGACLETRLTNMRRRMAEEGVCKSKRDKLTKVDVIATDKRLTEIYLAVVKEMAIRCGVSFKD